jgi:hypothetical protein
LRFLCLLSESIAQSLGTALLKLEESPASAVSSTRSKNVSSHFSGCFQTWINSSSVQTMCSRPVCQRAMFGRRVRKHVRRSSQRGPSKPMGTPAAHHEIRIPFRGSVSQLCHLHASTKAGERCGTRHCHTDRDREAEGQRDRETESSRCLLLSVHTSTRHSRRVQHRLGKELRRPTLDHHWHRFTICVPKILWLWEVFGIGAVRFCRPRADALHAWQLRFVLRGERALPVCVYRSMRAGQDSHGSTIGRHVANPEP